MKNRFRINLLYIFKKRGIIKAVACALIFMLVTGIAPVMSEELEVSGEEAIGSISSTVAGIWMPALFLTDYLINTVKLNDIKNIDIRGKDTSASEEAIQNVGKYTATEETKSDAINDKTGKIAYLTFDDGLDKKVTPQILDILKKYNVKATFFILGNSVDKNKDVLKRLVDEGHIVGNHTYTHKKSIIYTDVKKFSDELARTSKAIFDAVGIRTKLFRPPYGAPYIRSQEYKDALSNYKTVLWNVDSMDSRVKGITSREIAETVKNQVKNKRNAVILFHSTSARTETVKVLPEVIEFLINNGYSISLLE